MTGGVRTRWLARHIHAEGVVACPAEAVWGLSCDPFSASAVREVLALKGRPESKGLIIVVGDVGMLRPVLQGLPTAQRKELELSWPGAHTWLVPNRGFFPAWITGDSTEVAVRVTASPALAALSKAVGGPLVSTSANPAGALPARHSFQVVRYFGSSMLRAVGEVDLLGRPSTIRRAGSQDVLRV